MYTLGNHDWYSCHVCYTCPPFLFYMHDWYSCQQKNETSMIDIHTKYFYFFTIYTTILRLSQRQKLHDDDEYQPKRDPFHRYQQKPSFGGENVNPTHNVRRKEPRKVWDPYIANEDIEESFNHERVKDQLHALRDEIIGDNNPPHRSTRNTAKPQYFSARVKHNGDIDWDLEIEPKSVKEAMARPDWHLW